MNKLLFSEGGQPIYLEDLKMLQDNNQAMTKALLGTVMNQDEACLLQPYQVTNSMINAPDLSRTLTVAPGTLVYDGMLCPFEGAMVTVAKENSPWLCLQKVPTDLRVFEDGQQRYCQQAWTAYISTTAEGAEKSWKMEELQSWVKLLASAIRRLSEKSLRCIFYNGYSGQLTVDENYVGPYGRTPRFTIDISTQETSWRKDAIGWKGMLFRIEDAPWNDYLTGYNSPDFEYKGKSYHLTFGDGGNVFLIPQGVDDIYSDTVIIPLIPIRISFTYDEVLSTK